MLDLGRFRVNETHRVKVAAPRCAVRVELTDPRSGEPVPVEGARVCLVDPSGVAVSSAATTDRDGKASVLIVERDAGAVVRVELPAFFDFEARGLVEEKDLEALDTRPLLRLPEVWRSDRQTALFDDLGGRAKGGRLPALVPDGQGTDEAPWVLRLDHGWTAIDVGLSFHDTQTHARGFVDQGLMLEAFAGTKRVGGCTLVGADGHHRLRLFEAASAESLSLRFTTPAGTYLDLTDRSLPQRRLRTLPAGTVTPLGQRLERYALPELWLSRGQLASLDGGKTAKPFEEVAATLLQGAKTVEFDLDDVLLVDDRGRPIKVRGDVGVSVFGGDFVVKRPRTDEPQHSDIVIDRALLRGRDVYSVGVSAERPFAATRVIRRGRRFYEVDGSRSSSGRVVGVRKAVREAHPVIREPAASIEGAARHRADFHVFEGVGVVDLDGEPHALRVVLVHVSVVLRPEKGLDPETVESAVLQPARNMFALAAARWSGDQLGAHLTAQASASQRIYVREPASRRATKLVFHFPTIEAGLAMTNAFLVVRPEEKFRAHALLGSITLNVLEDLEEDGKQQSETETGEKLIKNTVAHEMGHILGLPDEYIETPGFRQPFRGLMHAFDEHSIMNDGAVPMLRHFAVMADALARHGGINGPFQVYSDTRTPDSAAGRVHRYSLPEDGPYAELADLRYGPKGLEYEGIVAALGDDFDLVGGVGAVDGVAVLSPRLSVKVLGEIGSSGGIIVREDESDLVESAQKGLRAWGLTHEGRRVVVLRKTEGPQRLPQRILVSLDARLSLKNRLSADARVTILMPTAQSGHAKFAVVDDDRVTMHRGEESRLARFLAGLPMTQQPALLCKGGGSSLRFEVGGRVVELREVAEGVREPHTYVAKLPTPAGGFLPLEGTDVARNLTASINNPENGLADVVTAAAQNDEVRLTSPPDLVIHSASSSVEVRSAQPSAISPEEFTRLAEVVGTSLGGTYEVEA